LKLDGFIDYFDGVQLLIVIPMEFYNRGLCPRISFFIRNEEMFFYSTQNDSFRCKIDSIRTSG